MAAKRSTLLVQAPTRYSIYGSRPATPISPAGASRSFASELTSAGDDFAI